MTTQWKNNMSKLHYFDLMSMKSLSRGQQQTIYKHYKQKLRNVRRTLKCERLKVQLNGSGTLKSSTTELYYCLTENEQ